MSSSRYIVGIDLGTTNSVLAFIDTSTDHGAPQVLPVVQAVAPGQLEPRDSLPSFLYLAAGPEFPPAALDLPWASGRDYTVGWLAREQGALVPSRVVSSAKSWLCHSGVDRTAPILPWQAPAEVAHVSPLEASTRYLVHLRDVWNATHAATDPTLQLQHQDVLLTVPASFDAAARELTVTAARQAGLEQVTLLEEPQAAFYAWLADQGESWRKQLQVGDTVLVCDIGGGTTDFSLIAVSEADGQLALNRVAVGEHILLGGDNMDLALALTVAEQLKQRGHPLDAWQTRSLWHACRVAKEQLLTQTALETTKVTVLGRGSKVIGGAISAELRRADLDTVLLGGFFPSCAASDRPAVARRVGLQEIGLPYASDAGITRHLAKFCGQHLAGARPSALLFNGGVMKAPELRGRIGEVLGSWTDGQPVRELPSASLDLAVARGAAYYGQARRGRGVRIRGGVARSYYIGIESSLPAVPGLPVPLKALCVVPFGIEEGSSVALEHTGELGMVVGEPVEFRFLSSTTRKSDAAGAVVERWAEGEIEELTPIHTAMADETDAAGTTIPVRLQAQVTEVGTLDLRLRARDGRSWKLEYHVRES